MTFSKKRRRLTPLKNEMRPLSRAPRTNFCAKGNLLFSHALNPRLSPKGSGLDRHPIPRCPPGGRGRLVSHFPFDLLKLDGEAHRGACRSADRAPRKAPGGEPERVRSHANRS